MLGTSILDDAHPEVARLIRWHAAEEIEHRAVAFDVLNRVDPRLRTRLAGAGGGIALLFAFWGYALVTLRLEDRGPLLATDRTASLRFWKQAARAVPEVGRALVRYARRDFHPDRPVLAPEMQERVDRAFRTVLESLAA